MTDTPPDWAMRRAQELTDDFWTLGTAKEHPVSVAFARYIAQHEQPPVDPIEQAGRQLVVDTQHNWPDSPWHQIEAAETLAGHRDYTLVVMAAIEGVRRGIELGKGGEG